jgi:origin recognition complex subunit 5
MPEVELSLLGESWESGGSRDNQSGDPQRILHPTLTHDMASQHAGYEQLVHEISSLFSGRAPSFLYVTDAVSPRTAALVVNSVLSSIARSSDASSRVYHAQVNAVACFNSRLLYDTVLNQLAQWEVKWAKGCTNWNGGDDGQRWNENLDGFLHGLKAVHATIQKGDINTTGSNKGKGKQTDDFDFATEAGQIVIVVERPERLAEQMPDLIVPLTRLAELVRLDLLEIHATDLLFSRLNLI